MTAPAVSKERRLEMLHAVCMSHKDFVYSAAFTSADQKEYARKEIDEWEGYIRALVESSPEPRDKRGEGAQSPTGDAGKATLASAPSPLPSPVPDVEEALEILQSAIDRVEAEPEWGKGNWIWGRHALSVLKSALKRSVSREWVEQFLDEATGRDKFWDDLNQSDYVNATLSTLRELGIEVEAK